MTTRYLRYSTAAIAAAAILTTGNVAAAQGVRPSPEPTATVLPNPAGMAKAKSDSLRYPYTAADIEFMTGMIGHHAQAIIMAGWVPSHGANASIGRLAERIINAQQDEIVTMQTWLRDRRQPVPDGHTAGMLMVMDGVEHVMLMPGMLTETQMKELDQARGTEFDRLFLTFMMQHHRGAVSMVKQLFESYGAGQDETVFKFASDVNVDQTTEIARMEKMLGALLPDGRAP